MAEAAAAAVAVDVAVGGLLSKARAAEAAAEDGAAVVVAAAGDGAAVVVAAAGEAAAVDAVEVVEDPSRSSNRSAAPRS